MSTHLQHATYGIGTTNIHTVYKDNNANSEGWPQVMIRPVVTRTSQGMTSKLQVANVDYEIQIYHNSAENARLWADKVDASLTTYRGAFQSAGFYARQGDDVTEDYEVLYAGPNRYIHVITMNYPFVYREKVS